MAGLIIDLMGVMGDMGKVVGELSELARKKKSVVINNDVEQLKSITAVENSLAGRYQKYERAARTLLSDIAMVLNTPAGGLTFSRLGEIISGQDDYPLYMERYNALKLGLDELKILNEHNRALIQNALELIDYTVNVLRSTYAGDEPVLDQKN